MANWNELVMARSPLQLGRYNYIREIFVDRIVHKYLYLLDWVSQKKFTLGGLKWMCWRIHLGWSYYHVLSSTNISLMSIYISSRLDDIISGSQHLQFNNQVKLLSSCSHLHCVCRPPGGRHVSPPVPGSGLSEWVCTEMVSRSLHVSLGHYMCH